MSATVFYPGGPVEPSYVVLANTSQTDVFTATDNFTVLNGVTIANNNGANKEVILHYFDGSSNILFYVGTVNDGTTTTIEYPQFPMRSGNKIKATGDATITVFLTLSRTNSNAPQPGAS